MSRDFDIVVVGAGPAGLAAATAAARAQCRVAVLDENPRMGGQIWRAGVGAPNTDPARIRAVTDFEGSGAVIFTGHQVVHADLPGRLDAWVSATQTLETFRFKRLIIATGARERFLPFPGWTLPGVFGAGGLQALVRGGYDIRGKRVVVAGTGPLLLAVAAHLRKDGAEIISIAEQTPVQRLMGFVPFLLSRPGKLVQAARLRAELTGVPYRAGCWPIAVEGDGKIAGVRFTNGKRTWTEHCDLLACGFHLVPNTESALLLGCSVTESGVRVDVNQQTSISDVYCAGEPTGIAGVDAALLQGKIAGLAAAGKAADASGLHRKRDAEAAFGRAMDRVFALRDELRKLAKPDTIVCRCEDVTFSQVQAQVTSYSSWTDAKLQTRCGMGPCQGRVCGPALEALYGWRNTSVRPPLFPIPIAATCSAPRREENIPIPLTQETSR